MLNKIKKYLVLIFIWPSLFQAQIANYVSNGSFEEVVPNSSPNLAKYWRATDTTKIFGGLLSKILSPYNVPLSAYSYQWPSHGNNYLISILYCPTCGTKRAYPINRLKQTLVAGKIYCFLMYVNLSNQSTHGVDAFGIYFSDNSIDTITRCNDPITYLTPQIQNPTNNIIVDTLNWVPITGTFVANGSEKYMMIGNFKSDVGTNKTLTNPTNLPLEFSEYLIDNLSCIELNLPAYAGIDKSIAPGDSAYLGRELDFAVDSGCTWYKLPNMTTPIKIASGLWVKPSSTSTYVVKQVLDCSPEKWDTVVVYMNLVGIEKLRMLNEELRIYPVPAKDFIELNISNQELVSEFNSVSIYNSLGLLLKEEEIFFINSSLKIKIEDLSNGVYSLQLKSNSNETVSKRFVISR